MTIHLASLLNNYHLSLHGLLVAIRPRSAMIHNHQPNLTHQLLNIKCLWWHNPNMTACIFSMSSYSCINGVMRCSLLHVLYGLVLMSTYWFISCSPIVRSCRRRYLCHLLSLLIISVKSFLEQDAHSINYHLLLHLLGMNSWWQYAKDHRISHM